MSIDPEVSQILLNYHRLLRAPEITSTPPARGWWAVLKERKARRERFIGYGKSPADAVAAALEEYRKSRTQ